MAVLSTRTPLGIITIIRQPLAAATMLMALPVLPRLASTMVPPGRNSPSCSARSIIYFAVRALIEPEGLRHSSSAHTPSTRTSGVLAMASKTVAGVGAGASATSSPAAPIPEFPPARWSPTHRHPGPVK